MILSFQISLKRLEFQNGVELWDETWDAMGILAPAEAELVSGKIPPSKKTCPIMIISPMR
jgi:hypothetical protein